MLIRSSCMSFGLIARSFAMEREFLPINPRVARIKAAVSLERMMPFSGVLIVVAPSGWGTAKGLELGWLSSALCRLCCERFDPTAPERHFFRAYALYKGLTVAGQHDDAGLFREFVHAPFGLVLK